MDRSYRDAREALDALAAVVAAYALALKDPQARIPSPLMAALESAKRAL